MTDANELSENKKEISVSFPSLHPPDLRKPFLLWTDTSRKSFGALLEKGDGKKRYPVVYENRLTSQAEAKYTPTEL